MNLYSLFILLLIIPLVSSCGILTHNIIAHTSLNWFEHEDYRHVIINHQPAFQNGVVFPDWGYNCFLKKKYPFLPDASEVAHHAPFQQTMIKYINSKYTYPWDQQAENIIAFLFGIVSHSVADIEWHNLYPVSITRQGFIQSLANVNFNFHGQSYNSSVHTTADTGGDFILAYTKNLTFLEQHWYLPVNDLVNIYQSLGFNQINDDIIRSCVDELFLYNSKIKKYHNHAMYAFFSHKAPFILDYVNDWWIGGLNDMSIWTNRCWENTIQSLITNNFSTCLILRENSIQSSYHDPILKEIPSGLDNPSPIQSSCFNISSLNSSLIISSQTFKPSLGYSQTISYNNLINIFPSCLVVGSPTYNGRGSVFIIPITSKYHNINVDSDDTIIRLNQSSIGDRFGSSVLVIDFNHDGIDDLVVTSTGYQSSNLNYYGQINIYLGPISQSNVKPDIVINSNKPYSNIGFSLSSGDINGDRKDDLIIGNPYTNNGGLESGQILIFVSSSSRTTPCTYNISQADITINNNEFFSWFGYTSTTFKINQSIYLIVSAPSYNNGTCAVGKIYAYHIINTTANLQWSIVGTSCNSQFGSSISIQYPILSISMPSNGSGQIYFISIQYLKGSYSLDNVTIFQIYQNSDHSIIPNPDRLGHHMGFTDHNNFWAIQNSIMYLWLHPNISGHQDSINPINNATLCLSCDNSLSLSVFEKNGDYSIGTTSDNTNIIYFFPKEIIYHNEL